jgi:hypothetical protein
MRKFTSPLEGVRVAAPCSADWEKMVGDERMRYCGQCSLHVYNLSGMTKREAEGLVANAEGRLCVRYYRRADGSILTRNCPVGLRAVKQRVSRIAGATLSAVLGFFAGFGLNLGFARPTPRQTMGAMVVPTERLYNVNVVDSGLPLIMGGMMDKDEVYGEPVQGMAVSKHVPRGRTHARRAR